MGQQYKQLCMEERCEIARRQRSGRRVGKSLQVWIARHQALLEN